MDETLKILIAYDGTDYAGWQRQKNQITIQECIETALKKILQETVSIIGAGRTDRGVHAEGQVAHFLTPSKMPLPILKKGLNALLPPDIRILSIEPTDSSFHARFSAKAKIYQYRICTLPTQPPFQRRFVYHFPHPLDLNLIKEASYSFLGTKNFKAFANTLPPNRNPIKTLSMIQFVEEPYGFSLTFKGDGFLYKMVRNIVGTLLDVGQGKISPKEMPLILESEDRRNAGKTAPPHGLTLITIDY